MPLLHVEAGSADQLQDIADALWKAKKVVVITGAGISTNSGIPDFRSENGLYSMIQSQFDAAAKLGAPKAELSGAVLDERPRKRRRTSPPVEDSIEVAPESLEAPASPVERDTMEVVGLEDNSSTTIERSINAATPRDGGEVSTKVEPRIEGNNDETTAQGGDEVLLLSEESILAGEHLLANQDKGRIGDSGAKEEVPDPPHLSKESNKNDMHMDEPHKASSAASPVASIRQVSRHADPSEPPPSNAQPAEEDKSSPSLQAVQKAKQPSGPPTPKSAPNSGPQTTSSSPLSSPPPAELFDSFDEQSTEPPSSSTRPSSPVSTENEDDAKDADDDESEPSFSQSYLNRSSTFRRSLSTLKGKELFDASIWSDPLKTSVFYTFATNLRQKSRDAAPTGCHQFIGHLSKAGKMVRCYTQNIDLLEDKVGLSTRLLLGAGSRSRFSTRSSRGAAAALGGSGPRHSLNNNNSQPISMPSISCAGAPTPSQPAIGRQGISQATSPSNSQGASAQLEEEVEIGRRLTSTDNGGPVEGSSKHSEKTCHGLEQDGATVDAQPIAAGPTDPEKPTQGADRGSSPEQDRGVECVFLHGSLRALRCFQCGCVTDWDDGRELQTMSGQQPPCPRCEDATNARQERGKRALGVGKLRPDIVLYGEDHPESQQISSIIQHDISLAPDMLIIMGTSLKVHGLKTVVREFAKTVHNRKDGKVIFVNYTKPAESVWADIIDFWVEMDCDSWVQDLKEKKPVIWMPPGSVEIQPRITIPKRRRTLNDEAEKEGKKSKKIDQTMKTAPAAPFRDTGKAKQCVKLETPTSTDAKPYVPKRPAAHRDCKQNAAYWTMKIVADLAGMTGRVVMPGPPPFRAIPVTQGATLSPTHNATQTSVSLKVRRGPRTKNTRSKVLEAAATTDTSEESSRPVKEDKSQAGPSIAKPVSRRRTKSGGAKEATTNATICSQDTVTIKQHFDEKPNDNVLVEVAIPNSGPGLSGEDVPMVAAVKNRIRKPKVFFGETDPPLVAPVRRGTPVAGVSARSKIKAPPQAKKAKAAKTEQTPRLDGTKSPTTGIQNAQICLLPVPKPRPQPPAAITLPCSEQDRSITLAPLRPSDSKPSSARRNSFFQMALGQSDLIDSVTPPPAFLEPAVSPGPFDKSPQMSPNHWRKRAFSYSNALSRHFETSCRNLDFTRLGSRDIGDPAYMEYPRPVPQPPQQSALVEAPPLLVGASIFPLVSPPVEPLSMPDSPNQQLHRESEAAAALTQMAGYDQRQFVRM